MAAIIRSIITHIRYINIWSIFIVHCCSLFEIGDVIVQIKCEMDLSFAIFGIVSTTRWIISAVFEVSGSFIKVKQKRSAGDPGGDRCRVKRNLRVAAERNEISFPSTFLLYEIFPNASLWCNFHRALARYFALSPIYLTMQNIKLILIQMEDYIKLRRT